MLFWLEICHGIYSLTYMEATSRQFDDSVAFRALLPTLFIGHAEQLEGRRVMVLWTSFALMGSLLTQSTCMAQALSACGFVPVNVRWCYEG